MERQIIRAQVVMRSARKDLDVKIMSWYVSIPQFHSFIRFALSKDYLFFAPFIKR